jgi:nucleoside-diphosphate-sugar epimerase
MKFVIFGASGFIGQNLKSYLLKKKANKKIGGGGRKLEVENKVFGFSNIKYFNNKTKRNFESSEQYYSINEVNFIKYNEQSFIKLISKIKPQVIYYLSGNPYPGNTFENAIYDFESSNIPLQHFLSAIHYLNFKGKVIYTSSIAVYGTQKICNEESKLEPKNFYALSKLICENQIKYFSKKYKLNITIARLCSIYGAKLKRQVIYKILKQVDNGSKRIKLNGSSMDARQFLHVNDAVELLYLLAKTKNKNFFNIFNIANGDKIKIKDIKKIINKIFKKKFFFIFLKKKIKDSDLPMLSNKKIIKVTKKKNFLSLENGIKKTYLWLKKKENYK